MNCFEFMVILIKNFIILCFLKNAGIMKKAGLLFILIAVSLMLLYRQDKIFTDYSYMSNNELMNNKIFSTQNNLNENQSVYGIKAKHFLKELSEGYFSLICHQNHSILLRIKGEIIPLCPRCMGLHLGFIITFCILTVFTKKLIRINSTTSFIILLTGLFTIGIEWSLAQFSIIQSTAFSRMFTGLFAGSVFGILTMIYKRKYTRSVSFEYFIMNTYHIISLISMSLTGITLIMLLNNWILINVLLLVSVTANFIIVIHIIILRASSVMQLLTINNIKP